MTQYAIYTNFNNYGDLILTAIINNKFYSQNYQDKNIRESKKLFIDYINKQLNK